MVAEHRIIHPEINGVLGKSDSERALDRLQIWKFSDLANGSPQSAFMAAAMPALVKTESPRRGI
jgi:hypothetical protein